MKTTRTLAIGIATLVGVGAGSYSIVAATNDEAPPARTDTDTDTDDVEEQDPQLDGSIKIVDVEDETEDAEDARLQALPDVISEADAAAAAVAEYPGDISESELGNENGSVVWEFEIVGTDGSIVEVKIDAGSATVLDIETDDGDESDDAENESEHDGDDAGDPDADNED